MYKLKNENGRVNSLLRSGSDFVSNKLAISAAQHIIDCGKLVESDREGFPICVDKKWYFEGEEMNLQDTTPKTPKTTRTRGKKA